MSCTSFFCVYALLLIIRFFSVSYCIFVPQLYRNKIVDNVQQNDAK